MFINYFNLHLPYHYDGKHHKSGVFNFSLIDLKAEYKREWASYQISLGSGFHMVTFAFLGDQLKQSIPRRFQTSESS